MKHLGFGTWLLVMLGISIDIIGLVVLVGWLIGLCTGCGISEYVKKTEVTTAIIEAGLEGLTRLADKQLDTDIQVANYNGDNKAKIYAIAFWNSVYDDINEMYGLTQNYVAQVKLENTDNACHFLSDLKKQLEVTSSNIDTRLGSSVASSIVRPLNEHLETETVECQHKHSENVSTTIPFILTTEQVQK